MCELSRASVTVAALVANFEGEDDHLSGRSMLISKSGRRPPVHPTTSSASVVHNGPSHPIRKQRSGTLLVQESECSVTVTLPITSKKMVDSGESSTESRNGASCSPSPIIQHENSTTSECSEEGIDTHQLNIANFFENN